MKAENLLRNIPAELPDELFETLLQAQDFRMERIVSHGHHSPSGFWYDQDEHEWVLVLEGRAQLEFEGQASPVDLSPGCYINISAHARHRVAWTDPEQKTVWLAIFYR